MERAFQLDLTSCTVPSRGVSWISLRAPDPAMAMAVVTCAKRGPAGTMAVITKRGPAWTMAVILLAKQEPVGPMAVILLAKQEPVGAMAVILLAKQEPVGPSGTSRAYIAYIRFAYICHI